jgi:ABC-2 type transport system ATP-binding protein
MNIIQVNSLCKYYGNVAAVNNVNFTIRAGEVVGLLGHNGAGKTTIMRMLTGYLQPSSGNVLLAGQPLEQNLAAQQALIGYLPEHSPLYPEMTVVAYLEYVAALKCLPQATWVSAIQEVLEATGLQEYAFSTIAILSRGYKQRLGVAQAILGNPKILILDEPTNGLDPSQIEQMRTLLRRLAKTSTLILSTHILQEVEAICDRVLIVKKGRLVLDATMQDLQQQVRLMIRASCNANQMQQLLMTVSEVAHAKLEILPDAGEQHVFALAVPAEGLNLQTISAKLIKLLVSAGYEVWSVLPEKRTLESVFHDSVSGVEHAT